MTTEDAVSVARAELLDLISDFGGVVRQVDEGIDALVEAAEQRGRESLLAEERQRWSDLEQVENLLVQRDAALARAEQAEARAAALRELLEGGAGE